MSKSGRNGGIEMRYIDYGDIYDVVLDENGNIVGTTKTEIGGK